MRRMRRAPVDLVGLADVLQARGFDLLTSLRDRLRLWVREGAAAAWRLAGRLVVVVEMPIIGPDGGEPAGADVRAFVTAVSAGEVAVALGVAEPRQPEDGHGFVTRIVHGPVDHAALRAVGVQCAEVHLSFDAELAARLSGHTSADGRHAVIVGAGSVGSLLAECLVREGRFTWTVVDDDTLLPHNLARHTATVHDIGRRKAEVLAKRIDALRDGETAATALNCNVLDAAGDALAAALDHADLVIDATASVAASRRLADLPSLARRISAFYAPAGNGAVLLAEPSDRSVTLRDLEAQYLGLVLRSERLAGHLDRPEMMAYTGACRALTNRIPHSRASMLAGLLAEGIGVASGIGSAEIAVWMVGTGGGVEVVRAEPERVRRFSARGWAIAIDAGLVSRMANLRLAKAPAETGGVLLGLVDVVARSVHVVHAEQAPPDSREGAAEFVRGTDGVDRLLADAHRKTAGQLRYVGEWHSHPPRVPPVPSTADARQMDWLASVMAIDEVPALMAIAGEDSITILIGGLPAETLP